MSNKDKDKELNKPSNEQLQEKADETKDNANQAKDVFPLGERNEKLNPLGDIADQSREKSEDEKTTQEEFLEGKDDLQNYRAAAEGGKSPGPGNDGLADNLDAEGKPKKIIPPTTESDQPIGEDSDDFTHSANEDAEEVPFEPVDDVLAGHHGTHDAAVFGLHTDVSGTYVPPGLVAEKTAADHERDNEERLETAKRQQREFAYDSGLRHNRRF